jgi:hypothetical protein
MLCLEAQVGAEQIEAQVDRVLRREVDPATAAARLLKEMLDDDA